MIWFFVAMVVVVLGCAAVVGSGRWGAMPELVDDRPVRTLPDGPLSGDDVRHASFGVVARGYAMDEVDALLARLAEQLDATHEDPADKAAERPDEWGVAPE